MEETLRSSLLELAERYETATGVTRATAAKRALNDNTFFARVSGGAGFNIKTFDRIVEWFSENWPQGTDWPIGLERPAPTRPFPGSAGVDPDSREVA